MQWLFRSGAKPFERIQWIGIGRTAQRILNALSAWMGPLPAPMLVFQVGASLPALPRLKPFPLLSDAEFQASARFPFCLEAEGFEQLVERRREAIKKAFMSHCSGQSETLWLADAAEPGVALALPILLELWRQTMSEEGGTPLLFLCLPWNTQPWSLQSQVWRGLDKMAQSALASLCLLGHEHGEGGGTFRLKEHPWSHPLTEGLACYLAQRAWVQRRLWDPREPQRVILWPLSSLAPLASFPYEPPGLPLLQESGSWLWKAHWKLHHIQLLNLDSKLGPREALDEAERWRAFWKERAPTCSVERLVVDWKGAPSEQRRSWIWGAGWPLASLSLSEIGLETQNPHPGTSTSRIEAHL